MLLDVERPNELVALLDLLRRRATIDRELVNAGGDLLLQAPNALHEELVEDRARDRQELHPLEQRRARVLRLVEHTIDEGEPRQLSIEVVLGCVEIDIRCWGLFLLVGDPSRRMPVGRRSSAHEDSSENSQCSAQLWVISRCTVTVGLVTPLLFR